MSNEPTDSSRGLIPPTNDDGQRITDRVYLGHLYYDPETQTLKDWYNDADVTGGGTSGTDTRVNVLDDGTEVVSNAQDLDFGNGYFTVSNPTTGEAQVALAADVIGSDELDLSISPTWTDEHDFSGGITGLPKPTQSSDAARKQYVDGLKSGFDYKDPCVVATDARSIDLSSATDPNPVDGVTLSDGDRLLLKDQSAASENGIYEAVTATDPTSWVRATDADSDDEVTSGLFTFVKNGTANINTGWVLTTEDPITVGSTALTFAQFSAAGDIKAGNALTKSGDTLDVDESAVTLSQLEDVSIQAMLEGTDSNKPAAGTAGRYYYATDIEILYRDNGTSWEAVAGHGTSSNPVPGTTHLEALSTGELTIGGRVFVEDGNSPINVSSTTSTTYSIAESDASQILIYCGTELGFDELQVNGDTGSNYDYIDNADTTTTGASQWSIPRASYCPWYHLYTQNNSIHFSTLVGRAMTNQTVGGINTNVSDPLTQLTFSDSGGTGRNFKARVYVRSVDI